MPVQPHAALVPSFASSLARDLPAHPVTAEGFASFGQLIEPTADGAPALATDRALDLSAGHPRFYIMALANRGLAVRRITRHRRATQVLASAQGESWLLAVAPPGDAAAPDLAAMRAFTIPGGVAVLLSRGTWHAGPYFQPAATSFFNLELEDTNEADHDTCDLAETFGISFTLLPAG